MDNLVIPSLSPSPSPGRSSPPSDSKDWTHSGNSGSFDSDSETCLGFSFSPTPATCLSDSLCGFNFANSMDLDPMATLFAFNASCNSPTCSRTDYSVLSKTAGSDCKSAPPAEQPSESFSTGLKHGYAPYTSASASASASLQQTQNCHYYQSTSAHNQAQSQPSPPPAPAPPLSVPPPPPVPPSSYHHLSSGAAYSPNASSAISGLSYSFHPQIPQSSSSNHGHCAALAQHHNVYNVYNSPQPGGDHSSPAQPLFPAASMSVNLSMNMTMGFTADPQLQWSVPGANFQNNYSNSSPASYHPHAAHPHPHPHQHSHPHPLPHQHPHPAPYPSPSPTSYTFTAEFRPASEPISLPPIDKEFPGVCPLKPPTPTYSHRALGEANNRQYSVHKRVLRGHNVLQELENSSSKQLSPGQSAANLCRICGKTYARPSTLKTHLRTHSGERPYRCHTCNKSFSQAANLTAHIRTHSGEKPFRCPVCDRRFSQSSSVTTHMRTHSGERPYRCCLCKKAFSDSSTLTKHLRIHSGEKPYQCKLCLLRFSQSGNLNRHMRIHSGLL